MNIYIVPAWYPENVDDLNASFIREQVQALQRRNHKLIVIYIKLFSIKELRKYFHYKNHVWDDNGIIVKYYRCLSIIAVRFKSLHKKNISHKFYKIISRSRKNDLMNYSFIPDVIHSHVGPWCAYYCVDAAKRINLPIVVTEHYSGLTNGNMDDIKFQREKYVLENASTTIFVGSSFQKYVSSITGIRKNMCYIPNFINMNLKVEQTKCAKSDKFSFLVACHLTHRKRVDLIIKAFHEEFKDENIALNIAGDGVELKNLKLFVESLNECKRINFLGKYTRENADEIFASNDCFALTSEFEPFGIVYIEAMKNGLPCIGTKGQGADDIINDTNGLLVKFGDLQELRKAMRHIYDNIAEYNRDNIKKYVNDNFSDNVICEKIENVYKKVINKENAL